MGLYERLQQIAGKLGLVRVVTVQPPATPPSPPEGAAAAKPAGEPVAMRTIRLDELAAEIRLERVGALAEDPGELTLELHRVIEAAGVGYPEHGWTVDRLHESVAAVVAAGADRAAVQRAVLAQLAADRVAVEDVVRDAIARDRAVDAWERFVRQKFEHRRLGRRDQIEALIEQAAGLKKRIDELEAEQADDAAQLDAWVRQKRELEDRWAHGLGYLIDGESPVTRDGRD